MRNYRFVMPWLEVIPVVLIALLPLALGAVLYPLAHTASDVVLSVILMAISVLVLGCLIFFGFEDKRRYGAFEQQEYMVRTSKQQCKEYVMFIHEIYWINRPIVGTLYYTVLYNLDSPLALHEVEGYMFYDKYHHDTHPNDQYMDEKELHSFRNQ